MKQTKFAIYLHKFFTSFLVNNKGCTARTIDSYRYSFILFLTFLKECQNLDAENVEITNLTYANIVGFLNWLQESRANSISTRNQRQAAINSFVRYLSYEFPENLDVYQKILSIPIKKRPQKEISYLKTDGVELLVQQINTNSADGLRDYVMIMLLYTTGIRVSELIQIKAKDVSLNEPCTLLVHGKGQKSRFVPLLKSTIKPLQRYMSEKNYDRNEKLNEWLFKNHMQEQFTRQGINYIVGKYADMARSVNPKLIPIDFSPHKMRHTTAMALVDSGVDLIYIRDLLGHVSVSTTEVYARADALKKRQAIEAASKEIVAPEEAEWDNNTNLKNWLKNFNKNIM